MPIDPRIALAVQPAQLDTPFQTLTSLAQLQQVRDQTEARRLAADKARQEAADDAAIRRVLTETGGDFEQAMPRLRMIAPGAALKFETELTNQRKAGFDALKSETELRGARLDVGLQVARSMNSPAGYSAGRPLLIALSPELESLLPEEYDPAVMERLGQMGLTAKELADQRNDALKLFTEGKVDEGLGRWFSTVRSEEEWNTTAQRAVEFGIPRALVEQFGAWSPDAPQRAARLAISPKDRETLAGQAEAREQTAANQAAQQANAAAQLDISRGNLAVAQGNLAVARQRLAQGTGSGQDREALMQAVIANPGLWDQITPTERGKIAGELNARGFTGFGKPLSDGAIKQIADSQSAIASLRDLREVVKQNEQYIGPIAGLAALNPYSEARKAQADVDRVRQRVGKAMEGGVLRKEDEEKYKRILATLTDVPETAVYKIDQLMQDLQRDIDNYTHQQRLAGRRVPAASTETNPLTVTAPNGKTYTFKTAAEAAAFKKRAGIP